MDKCTSEAMFERIQLGTEVLGSYRRNELRIAFPDQRSGCAAIELDWNNLDVAFPGPTYLYLNVIGIADGLLGCKQDHIFCFRECVVNLFRPLSPTRDALSIHEHRTGIAQTIMQDLHYLIAKTNSLSTITNKDLVRHPTPPG